MKQSPSTTEFYLIRHAETVMNTNPHLIGGRSNETPLTDKGVEQSKRLGKALLNSNIIPDAVYASPAVRTQATARHSLGAMGLSMQPIIHIELHELSQGAAEGQPRQDIYTPEVLASISQLGKDFKLPEGESMNDVGKRMHTLLTRIAAMDPLSEPKHYFVYTHGGAIKYLASYIYNWPHEQTYTTRIDNTSVSLFVVQDGNCEMRFLNQDAAGLSLRLGEFEVSN